MYRKYNDIEFLMNNYCLGDTIQFEYMNSLCIVESHNYARKDYEQDISYVLICSTKGKELDLQYYNSIEELFEKGIVEDKTVQEIWPEVKIRNVKELLYPKQFRHMINNYRVGKEVTTIELCCCNQFNFKVYHVSNDRETFCYSAVCPVCGKEVRLYHSKLDGYGNCLEKNDDIEFIKEKKQMTCKCENELYHIELSFEYPADLEESGLSRLLIPNAYTWIWMRLKCKSCHKKKTIDYETA